MKLAAHIRRLAANLFAWSGVMIFTWLVCLAAACDDDETAEIVDGCLEAAGLDFVDTLEAR